MLFVELLGGLRSILLAFLCFFVEQGGLRCRPPSSCEPTDDHDEQKSAPPYSQLVANSYRFAWFRPSPINLYLAARNSFCCKRTRLEKTRCPQPFI